MVDKLILRKGKTVLHLLNFFGNTKGGSLRHERFAAEVQYFGLKITTNNSFKIFSCRVK